MEIRTFVIMSVCEAGSWSLQRNCECQCIARSRSALRGALLAKKQCISAHGWCTSFIYMCKITKLFWNSKIILWENTNTQSSSSCLCLRFQTDTSEMTLYNIFPHFRDSKKTRYKRKFILFILLVRKLLLPLYRTVDGIRATHLSVQHAVYQRHT